MSYGSHSEFGSLVPAREVVVDSREQARLGEAQEPAGGHEPGVVRDESHGSHADAPEGAAQEISTYERQGKAERISVEGGEQRETDIT